MGDGRGSAQVGCSLTSKFDSGELASVEAVIRRRRMTREFSSDPLDPQHVADLVDTARRAPTAGYSQGVHFVVLTGDAVGKFWQTTDAERWFAKTQAGVLLAPVIVLPIADPSAYTSRYSEADKAAHGLEVAANWPVPFWLTDTAMAVQNLLLLVEAQRLGALYFGIFRNVEVLLADLGVPQGMLSVGAVAMGHRAATDRPTGSATTRPRRAATEVVHHNHW
jgi:nitroreductase